MIKGILVINNHGKPRLTKFYEHLVARPAAALRVCACAVASVCRCTLQLWRACGAPGSHVDHAARKQQCSFAWPPHACSVCVPRRVSSCLPFVHPGLTPVPAVS
jgi:hypothetical protein